MEEDFNVGVETAGRDGGEVEDFANDCSAAPDGAHAVTLTGIVGDGSKACKRAGLFVADGSKLGQACDERFGDDRTEAWDRGENGIALGQAVIGLDAFECLAPDRGDMDGQLLDPAGELTLQ